MTLGEIAYNAYCHAVEWKSVRGDPLPQFIDQFPQLKVAWEAAAGAVLEAVQHGELAGEIFRDGNLTAEGNPAVNNGEK